MKDLICDWLLGCAFAAQSAVGVADLQYGTVLFHYFQHDLMQALTRAQVIEASPGLAEGDRIRAALAAQMIALQADVSPPALAADRLSIGQRQRLLMARARVSHRHQQWDALDRVLMELEGLAPDASTDSDAQRSIRSEARFFRAERAAALGQFDIAWSAIDGIEAHDPRRAYALFNLGVSMNTFGASKRAVEALTRLDAMDVYAVDALDLKQRARLALALINLQQTKSASAERLLSAIPAQSRFSAPALATFGSLAMKDGEHALAARVWTTLVRSQGWSSTGTTAQLALPMSLEQITPAAATLAQFREAEEQLRSHRAALRQLSTDVLDPVRMAALLHAMARAFGEEGPTLDPSLDDFQRALGHRQWTHWFADDATQSSLDDLLTVDRMIDALVESLAGISGLAAVARERQRRNDVVLRRMAEADLHGRRARLRVAVESLRTHVAALTSRQPSLETAWMLVVADESQTQRVLELDALGARLNRLPDDEAKEALRTRTNRMRAALFWALASTGAGRLQAAQQDADRLTGQLNLMDARAVQIDVQVDEADSVAALAIDDATLRTRSLIERLTVSRRENEHRLGDIVRSRIEGESARIDQQITLAQVAIARAMDRAAAAQDSRG